MSPRMSRRRIALIGAGGAGACTALELAARGHRVELFERHGEAVAQATFANEGKIHLGLIYALDRSFATASQMIEGALEFESAVNRWLPFRAADIVSTPFLYGVHRGSLLDPEALLHHYRRCVDHARERSAARGLDYLGSERDFGVQRLAEVDHPEALDPSYLDALFRTSELALDPRVFARLLREALAASPRVALRLHHRVVGVRPAKGSGYQLAFERDGARHEEWFSDVANTSWYERLPLDRPLGIAPPAPWSHRYKFGHRIAIPLAPDRLPSLTYVQGPFGDLVNFGERGLFLSWYPTGRTGMSSAEVPPDWHAQYSRAERFAVFERSFEAWQKRCPGLATLPFTPSDVDPYGGVIYALGTTDVDDGASRLHERSLIGIQSRGCYHSLDPGKFTLVPSWAIRLADRIEAAA